MMDQRLSGLMLDAHPSVEMSDLIRAQDVIVICEGEFTSQDGDRFWVYTVGGVLDDERIEQLDHDRRVIIGATIAGDVIIIHAKDRKEADWIATHGLSDSIDAMRKMHESGVLDPGSNSGIITETQARPKAS